MSPEITTPLFVSPPCIPLSLRLAAKVLSGRKDLHEIAKTQPPAACFSHTPPGAHQPPGFLNKCRDPRIDELRLDGPSSPLANYAQPRILLRAICPHSRSQSLISSSVLELPKGSPSPTLAPQEHTVSAAANQSSSSRSCFCLSWSDAFSPSFKVTPMPGTLTVDVLEL